MCEFKPGDEVVYVGVLSGYGHGLERSLLTKGAVYTVSRTIICSKTQRVGITVVGYGPAVLGSSFRKVQRLDISEWLDTATKFEEPKRKRANA